MQGVQLCLEGGDSVSLVRILCGWMVSIGSSCLCDVDLALFCVLLLWLLLLREWAGLSYVKYPGIELFFHIKGWGLLSLPTCPSVQSLPQLL